MRKSGKIGYIKTLDGWRAIAILIVLLAHGQDSITSFIGNEVSNMHSFGLLGVRIFFGLSGYLITLRIIEEVDVNGHLSLKGFYIRRFFRIIPPLAVFCLTTLILGVSNIIPVSISEWLGGLLFFSNLVDKNWFMGHLWSLSVEEHFYLIWPIIFILTPKNKLPSFIIISVILLSVWRIIAWKFQLYSSPAIFWGRSDIQFDGLLWGCFFAVMRRHANTTIINYFSSNIVFMVTFMLFVLTLMEWSGDYKVKMFIYSFQSLLIALMIFYTSNAQKNILTSTLEIKLLRWIGRLSYSIYLWQQLFFVPNTDLISSMTLVQSFPLNLIVVIMIATFSYYVIERKFIRLGHKLAKPVTEGRLSK
nr:acyltransferase [uncultured Methylophaga sp.]